MVVIKAKRDIAIEIQCFEKGMLSHRENLFCRDVHSGRVMVEQLIRLFVTCLEDRVILAHDNFGNTF